MLFDRSQTSLLQYPSARAGAYATPESVRALIQWPGATATCTLPNTVTSIEYCAFSGCVNLTNVTIPNSVVYIGEAAFEDCASLEAVSLPSALTYLPTQLFSGCTSLRRVTIPQRVTRLEQVVFEGCTNLTGVYFEGNAPSVDPTAFWQSPRFTLYHLPNTAGWGKTLGGLPTAPWLPEVVNPRPVVTDVFGFGIRWASGRRVVIQACTNLANPEWSPLETQLLSNGTARFSDTNTTAHPQRFYRVRQP